MYDYHWKATIVLCFLVLSGLFLCHSGLYAQQRITSQMQIEPFKGQAKVMSGPDQNAVYIRLRSGKPKISEVSSSPATEPDQHFVEMSGFPNRMSPGNPMLPYMLYQVALPPDADPASLSLEIIRKEETEMPNVYRLVPCPPKNICQNQDEVKLELSETEKWGVGKNIVDGKNTLVYEQDRFFPKNYCKVNYMGQLRKWKIASVIYCPMRYNPVSGTMVLAAEVDIKVKFTRDAEYIEKPETYKLLRDATFDDDIKGTLLNYDKAKNWYVKALLKSVPMTEKGEPVSDPDYAIITTEDIFDATNGCDALDDFCFHKENLGFEVIVVTEHQVRSVDGNSEAGYAFSVMSGIDGYEDVAGAPAPEARPEQIRKWLQTYYLDLGIKYVLLLGNPDPDNAELDDDVGNLPMKNCQLHIEADVPTDFYFAELSEGNWDLDGDGLAGEFYDSSGEYWGIPAGIINKSSFSVRWQGVLEVDIPEVYSTLDGPATAGAYRITVADPTGFMWHQVIRIGNPGDADEELVQVGYISGNQIRFYSPLVHDHPDGTVVSLAAGVARIKVASDGNTSVQIDLDNDGFDAGDYIHDDDTQHLQYPEYDDITVEEGIYPVLVEYSQNAGDAYCKVKIVRFADDVEISFKHDDGSETFVDGLDGDFFNSTDFSGVAIDGDSYTYYASLAYIEGGDMGPGGVEFLPELIVGRIPCYDEDTTTPGIDYDKMSLILNKIIDYEHAVLADNPWRRHVLTSCPYVADYPEHPSDPLNEVFEYNTAKYMWSEMLKDGVATPPLWNWHRIYMEDYGLVPVPETIPCSYANTFDAWDDGKGVVMWMSHGDQRYASSVIMDYSIDALDDSKPSIVFMGACNNGEPEFDPPNGLPLGYTNLKNGAVATVSASRSSYG